MQQQGIPRVLFTVADVSAALGIGRTLAWRLVQSGEIASVRIGRRRLVPAAAVEAYIARLARAAEGGQGAAAGAADAGVRR